MKSKGKEVAGKGSSGKRMREDTDKTGRKRKNRGVLQFFDDAAYEVDENESSEFSDFDDDFFEDEFGTDVKVKNEPGKAPQIPVLPKEEEMSEEELEKMLQERYKPGSSFVTYAEDGYDSKRSVERNAFIPSRDPTIWKVKCMVGRERHSAFCLMQKYLDLHSLGTKLQIISAFALEHVKGFIYIEADKHNDVNEACKGLCGIYSSRVAAVPKNEVSHLMSVRSKYNEVSQGTWARVKNGRYKGDLAQVVAVHHAKKKATVKLIPRIDLQVLGEKFGGGVKSNKAAIPAPRLLCSSELEEFRPLIQSRRDRDTGEFVEVLDGMMLKDGYLYKKISLDSLSCWGVVPLEEELLKFEFSKKDESEDLEWLSQLYGEPKKERTVKSDKGGKGGGKGEGSSSSSMANSFDVHDLVFFRRKDFGVIIGSEKDDSFKILKEGLEGPVVVTVDQLELKNASFDKRLTALDHRMKTILINDTVRVTEGPLEGKQGIVKKIYRGTIFLYNEHEQENGGYFCSKSQMCEKIKLSDDACNGKGDKSGPSVFEDFPSSPKSPLSPKKPWQPTENNRNFNQGDKDGMFSVGQSLRIRVGPLKGYLCRVLAIRRSDVTVKLDSQQKVLTVKCEHLSEVRGKSSAIPIGESGESVKPFDLLGTQDTSRDWIDGVGTSAEGEKWGAGGLSTERNAWPAFPSSSISIQPEGDSVQNDTKKDVGDGAWGTKVTSNKTSSWGTAAADEKAVDNSEQVGGWNKATTSSGFGSGSSDNWGKAKISSGGDQTTGDTWGKAKLGIANPDDSSNENQDSGWKKSNEQLDKGKNVTGNLTSSWNNASAGKNPVDSWGKGKDGASGGSAWGKAAEKLTSNDGSGGSKTNWDGSIAAPDSQTGSWGNMGLSSAQPEVEASGWKKATSASGGSAWGKAAEKLTSNDGSGGSKTIGASDNQTGSWGNTGRSSAQPEIEASGWKKATNADGGQSENWGNMKKDGGQGKGGPAWGKATDTQDRDTGKGIGEDSWGKAAAEKWSGKDGSGGSKAVWNSSGAAATENQTGGTWGSAARPSAQTASWGTPKSSGGGQESGGWNNGGTGNKDDTVQQDSWGSPKVFDGGRGSGGRWGRGGGGRGGRDQFGRGRSFGGAQSSGWSKGEENYGTGDGNSGQSGGWGKAKAFDAGKQDDGCNKSNASGEDRGTSWNEGSGGIGDQKGGWNKRKAVDDNQNTPWGTKTNNVDGNRSWDTQKASQDRSSGWNQKSADNENDGVNKDQQGGWNSKKTSDGGSETGWGQSSKWNSGASDSAGTQNSGWGNKSNWSSANTFSGSGTSDFGGSENQTDSFGSRGRGGNWRGGRGGSDRGGRFGGRDNSDRGRFGGGDNSERGGFGGRDSERGGFRGRGNSDRGRSDWGGGFRGRGGSDRGGFGGRGRGRRDDFGDQKSYDWNKSSDNNTEGWKSTGGGSWNQSGADKGQGQSWSSGWNQSKGANGNGGTSDQAAVGWNKGSGSTSNSEGWKSTGGGSWNQSGADKGKGQSWSSGGNSSKEAEGNAGTTDQAAGGWSKGSGNAGWNQSGADKGKGQSWSSGGNSSKGAEGIAGTTDQAAGGWSKGSGNAGWNQSGADKGKGQSWSSGGNSSKGAEGNAGTTDEAAGGWSKGSGNAGWNQPKEAKGATEDGGPADAWGKSAGSWGKGNGGGGKGGW